LSANELVLVMRKVGIVDFKEKEAREIIDSVDKGGMKY
jgi:hypothetical protein